MLRWLPPLAAAATGILVGSAMVATRYVIGETTPAALAFLRYLIGVCCMLPALLCGERPRFARGDLLPIALLGITQFGILIALLNYALQFIPSARAALIFSLLPLLTMLLAAGLGRERLTPPKALGVLVTIGGVGCALGEKALQWGGGLQAWVGELAVLASACCGATCSVLYRPYLRRYPTLPVSALAMLASVGFLAVLAAAEGFFATVPRFSAGGWLAVGFIGANSGVGYFLWLWALNHTTPTRVTVFLALSPVTASLLGAALLGEPLSVTTLAGVAGVILGLWLAHRDDGRPTGGRAPAER
jgi:drug/metabolite transporter (DMT)-like permease